MKTEGFNPGREQFIIKSSRWHNRYFKSMSDLQATPRASSHGWQYQFIGKCRGCIFSDYYLQQDQPALFQAAIMGMSQETDIEVVEYICQAWGSDGESYQDVFNDAFCEEMFVPLEETIPELEGGWIPITIKTIFDPVVDYEVTWWPAIKDIGKDGFLLCRYNPYFKRFYSIRDNKEQSAGPTFYRPVVQELKKEWEAPEGWFELSKQKPFDGATCDFCDEWSGDYGPLDMQTAEYRHWISHPGGEATANAGPGFVDEHGFPAFEEPVWWRYHEEPLEFESTEPTYSLLTEEGLKAKIEDAMAYPRTPDECLPPSSNPTPS